MYHVDRDDIERMPAWGYDIVRDEFRTGDIVFCSGKGSVLGRLIRGFTNSPWTHVGMLFWWDDRLMLLHSAEKGVQFYPFTKYQQEYQGALVVARHGGMTDEKREWLTGHAADFCNIAYDKWELVRIAWRIGWGIPRKPRTNDTYVCSELVATLLDRVGLAVAADKRGFTSPENVWLDPNVQAVCRIR